MGVDIARVGSGSTGATNVSRALGWRWALAVLLLDALKGYVPAALAFSLASERQTTFGLMAGCAAILGHCASPFLRFRGGKGIATGLGMLLGSIPWVALVALGVFLAMMAAFRIVSLSSLVATAALAPLAWAWGLPPEDVAILAALTFFVAYRHRGNLRRLWMGVEPKLALHGPESKGKAPEPGEESESLNEASLSQKAASGTSNGGAAAP
jgi:glycerol-3-phosphate acyltransferase PlsY